MTVRQSRRYKTVNSEVFRYEIGACISECKKVLKLTDLTAEGFRELLGGVEFCFSDRFCGYASANVANAFLTILFLQA